MAQNRHYVKVPPSIERWVPSKPAGDWQRAIFDDITEHGTRLVAEPMVPNDLGVRIAAHGDRYYAELGRDRERADTLFVTRIGTHRLPRTTPSQYECRLELWPGGNPPAADPVLPLFGLHDNEPAPEILEEPPPSPSLLRALASLAVGVRPLYRPGTDVPLPTRPAELLQPMRVLAVRFRVDRYLEVTPRLETLLRRPVTPNTLSPLEQRGLVHGFGLTLLNRLAAESPDLLPRVLPPLAALPLSSTSRATIWASTLAPLGAADLRRELHECADGLIAVSTIEFDGALAWNTVVVPVLRDLASVRDDSLGRVLDQAVQGALVLSDVGQWARSLFFREPEAEQSPAAPTIPPEAPREAAAEIESAADLWLLRLRVPDVDGLEQLRVRASACLSRLPTTPIDSLTALQQMDEALRLLTNEASRWQQVAGDVDAILRERDAATAALGRFDELVSGEGLTLVTEWGLAPDDISEIADLLEHVWLPCAPAWLFSDEPATCAEEEMPILTAAALARRMAGAAVRARLRLFCDLASALEYRATIGWLERPKSGHDVDLHLRDWYQRARDFIDSIPQDLRHLLDGAVDLEEASRKVRQLARVREGLPASLWASIEDHLSKVDDSEQGPWLDAYAGAVEFLRSNAMLDLASWGILRRKAEQLHAALPTGVPGPTAITVVHNYTEGRTRKPTLTYVPSPEGADYGFVQVPLALEANAPRDIALRLDLVVRGDARENWPRDWPAPEPSPQTTLSFRSYGWRHVTDTDRWQHDVVARIPIRKPRTSTPRLTLDVRVLDAATDGVLSPAPAPQLTFDSMQLEPKELALRWSDATSPEHVRKNPIGPQQEANRLLTRLQSGSNVAVIAPRRFGKSSLVEFLVQEGRDRGLLMLPALIATHYAGASGFDYETFWRKASDSLVECLGKRLLHDSGAPLPAPDAFDAVRREAKSRGYQAIVLLVDEAQLFFAPQHTNLGSHLKTLLERHLARTDDGEVAPFLFGFVGLPSLRDRAGADLLAVLAPVEASDIGEEQLRSVIASTVPGLQTTHGARARLARASGNLLILRTLLDRLISRLARERRVWAGIEDVDIIESELKRDLHDGREKTLECYIRDVLNSADRVESWKPVEALPVAAAWAAKWAAGRTIEAARQDSVDLLNRWCRQYLASAEPGASPMYTLDVLDRRLQQLAERRVLHGYDIVSPLLHAWLLGLTDRGALDPAFRDALFAGAQRRIQLPSGADPIDSGAQATVWRHRDERSGKVMAYRVRQLSSQEERDYFLESQNILTSIRDLNRQAEAGSDYLFELLDIGLSDRNDAEAVQMYRWVPGRTLGHRQQSCSADMVIDIGAKLARALALLHRHNILHRDIRPSNIVLDDESDETKLRPVLIDFGFARLATNPSHTAIVGDHIAPEVLASPPVWTRAADVYALGSTLRSLLVPGADATGLDELLESAMTHQAQERPTAQELLVRFEALEDELRLAARRQEFASRLDQITAPDRHRPEYMQVKRKMQEALVSVAMGYDTRSLHRYGVTADFLNQLVERSLSTSLGALADQLTGDEAGHLKQVAAIRHAHVHSGTNRREEQKRLIEHFEAMEDGRRHQLFMAVTTSLVKRLGLRTLADLVSRLVGASG